MTLTQDDIRIEVYPVDGSGPLHGPGRQETAAVVPGRQETAFSPGAVVRGAGETLDRALGTLSIMATKVSALARGLGDVAPDEFEVTFGVKVSATGDVFIARSGAEAQLSVTYSWKKQS